MRYCWLDKLKCSVKMHHLEYKLAEARALEASSSTSARVSQLSAAGISIVGFVVVLLIGLFTIRGIVGATPEDRR